MLSIVAFLQIALLATLTSAHFQINYPYWRQDSFEDPYSQYTFPCAGVNQSISNTNRTLWPLTGGSLNLALHHPATPYIFINLAIGSNATNFNISLIGSPSPINETGNGTFCLPRVVIPEGLVTDGMNASIQVVTVGERGSALYNCADITFSNAAKVLEGDSCSNTTGLTAETLSSTESSTNTSSSPSSSSSTAASGAEESLGRRGLWVSFAFASALALGFSQLF